MAGVNDVAQYLVTRLCPVSAMKLHKLLYYAQAWHLVWEDELLFPERIEAWANGPVVPEIYRQHRGAWALKTWERGSEANLRPAERETLNSILRSYGHLTARQLSVLTHEETPWQATRGDLPPTARSTREITPADMQEYYSTVDLAEDATPIDDIDWRPWQEPERMSPPIGGVPVPVQRGRAADTNVA